MPTWFLEIAFVQEVIGIMHVCVHARVCVHASVLCVFVWVGGWVCMFVCVYACVCICIFPCGHVPTPKAINNYIASVVMWHDMDPV